MMRPWIALLEATDTTDLRAQVIAMQASLPARWRSDDGSIAHKNPNFERWLAAQSDEQLPDLIAGLGAIVSYLKANPKARMRAAITRRPRANLATLQVMLQRSGPQFVHWLQDLYKDDDTDALQQCRADPKCMLDMLEDYLRDLGINVRKDGLISFWMLDRVTQRLIGDLPIALYHFTSSRMLSSIRTNGLEGDRQTVNYRTVTGVYLTTEQSGNAVSGYVANAVRHHGGHGVMLTVKCYVQELSADPDDANIASGRTQFVVDHVPPDRILVSERA